MATYKVIQDIEAEDKFLGPLTLKQFIFGAAGMFFGYLGFFAVTQGATFLLVLFLPPMILGFFLAIPWSSEQPTEVWVLAKMRFKLKPQIRIWNQSGLEELVTITVPKKVEKHLTNGLDQNEVQSRLKALAETIDSRGWAVKNATLLDSYSGNDVTATQRLINPAAIPPAVPEIDLNDYTDVLDDNNQVSENFEHMIQSSTQQRRQQSLDKMERIRHGEPLNSIQQPPIQFTPPGAQQFDEQAISQQLRNQRSAGDVVNSNMRTLPAQRPAPTAIPTPVTQSAQQPLAQMTNPDNPDILDLAQNNDLNVATIARQAHKNEPRPATNIRTEPEEKNVPDNDNEIVISLR